MQTLKTIVLVLDLLSAVVLEFERVAIRGRSALDAATACPALVIT